jgi:hypothetical protein
MAGRSKVELSLSRNRSAITNGTHVLHDLDHRGAWARRLKDLIAGHLTDLGGIDNVSEAEKLLVRRCAMLALQLELQEQRFALNEGGEATSGQIEVYQRVVNTLRRTLETLGLQRRPKDITPTPTLDQYLRANYGEEAAE